jgi:tetratricopeptide (TPR) repeat protein
LDRRARRKRADADRPEESTTELAVRILLVVVVFGSALALGGVHPIPIFVIALLTAVATVLTFKITPAQRWRDRLGGPARIGLALSVFTLVQAAPLPIALLRRLAPRNADVWSRSLAAFGEGGPAWATLSLDPGATLLETLKWLTYTGVFACSTALARRRGRTWGVIVVFASGVLLALVTMGHGLAGASKVYGFYAPHFNPAPWHVGPLLNTNNLSGYLNLAAMCGLGLLLSRQSTMPRWIIALGITILGAVVVISASRGGVLALLLGLLFLAVLLVFADRTGAESSLPKRRAGALLAAAIGGAALLAGLGSTRDTWRELYDKNLIKVRMLGWARPMIAEHWSVGVGRGAFESVFPAYRDYSEHIVFTHAENFPAQWMAEWGLPVALAALGAFAWFLRPAVIGIRRSIFAAGVGVGIAVLLLQNMFDLGIEVSSICIALAMAFGSVWGGWEGSSKLRRGPTPEVERRAPHGTWAIVVGVAVLIFAAVGPFQSLHDVAQDRYDLHQEYRVWIAARSPGGKDMLRRGLRDAMRRHPAEPYFPLLAAQVFWYGRGPENPLPALARSLERASQNGRAHLLLAEMLAATGARSQARLEIRLAVADEPVLAGTAAQLAGKIGASVGELLEAVPPGASGIHLLDALSAVVIDPAVRLGLLQELLARAPSDGSANARLAEHYLSELARGERSVTCSGAARETCERAFESSTATIERLRPSHSQADQYRARLLLLKDKPDEAEALLASRCANVDDPVSCQFLRTNAAAAVKGRPEIFHTAIRELQQVACGSAAECAATASTIGDMLAARGEWGAAFTYYKRVCKEQPTDASWLRLAEAASKMGSHAQAADALENAARLRGGPMDDGLKARIQVERNLAFGIVRE